MVDGLFFFRRRTGKASSRLETGKEAAVAGGTSGGK